MSQSWDVLVVGAGPGGCAAAISLARTGQRVMLVDRALFPRFKVCGGCLNLRAVGWLEKLGISGLASLGAIPLHSAYIQTKTKTIPLPLPGGNAWSREALDTSLVERALQSGVVFRDGTAATWEKDDVHIIQQESLQSDQYKLIVAADGLKSSLLRQAGSPSDVASSSRIGAGLLYSGDTRAYTSGLIYLACGREGYVGLTRVEDDKLDIAAAFDPAAVREYGLAGCADRVLREARVPVPEGLADLSWKGTPPLTRRAGTVVRGRVFAVGDAASYVEPFTGEGIAWALESGIAVAQCLLPCLRGEVTLEATAAAWEERHRQFQRRQTLCRMVAGTLRRPYLVSALGTVLQHYPRLANPVIRHLNGI